LNVFEEKIIVPIMLAALGFIYCVHADKLNHSLLLIERSRMLENDITIELEFREFQIMSCNWSNWEFQKIRNGDWL